jgi:drug/metabolite transporter superfamily protein YnfA
MFHSNGENSLPESIWRSIVTARRQRFGKRTGEVRTDLSRLDRDVLKLWTTNVSSTTSTYAQYQGLSTGDTTNTCWQKQWQWFRQLKPRQILGNAVVITASYTVMLCTLISTRMCREGAAYWGEFVCHSSLQHGNLISTTGAAETAACVQDIGYVWICYTWHYTWGRVYVILPGN